MPPAPSRRNVASSTEERCNGVYAPLLVLRWCFPGVLVVPSLGASHSPLLSPLPCPAPCSTLAGGHGLSVPTSPGGCGAQRRARAAALGAGTGAARSHAQARLGRAWRAPIPFHHGSSALLQHSIWRLARPEKLSFLDLGRYCDIRGYA